MLFITIYVMHHDGVQHTTQHKEATHKKWEEALVDGVQESVPTTMTHGKHRYIYTNHATMQVDQTAMTKRTGTPLFRPSPPGRSPLNRQPRFVPVDAATPVRTPLHLLIGGQTAHARQRRHASNETTRGRVIIRHLRKRTAPQRALGHALRRRRRRRRHL